MDASRHEGPSEPPSALIDIDQSGSDAFSRSAADVAAFHGGDPHAFERIWLRYLPALEILLASRFRASLAPRLRARLDADLDDVLQASALAAFSKLSDFEYRGSGSLLAWLSTIALRTARDRVDYWAAEKRGAGMDVSMEPSGTDTDGSAVAGRSPAVQHLDPARHPPSEAALREKRRRVAEVIGALSERDQQIVLLRFFGDASWDEVARQLGSSSGEAVKKECFRRVLPAIAAAMSARKP